MTFAQELVRIQSYSGQEEAAIRAAAAQMQALGYDEVTIDRTGNALGRIGSEGKSILFDSHLDTVRVSDAEAWARPPFSGEVADGWLWGRGAVDMKSGAAASIYGAAAARERGWTAGKTVYVSCTVDEEFCDGEALRRLLEERSLRPDFAVTCEPSGNRISTGHKGKAQIVVRTQGVSAHGSAPEKGLNAVYEMAEIIQRVEQANLALMAQSGRHGTLVLSRISSSGVSLNAVPAECEIYLDRRMAAGETEQTVRDELARITAGKRACWEIDVMRRKTWTGAELVYEPLHPAWEISLEHELARAFIAAYGETFGRAPEAFEYWDFSTNAVATVRLGIPTIGFGPGDHKLAHMRDERCAVREIQEAGEFYAQAIRQI